MLLLSTERFTRALHPDAARIAINRLLSREVQTVFQRIFLADSLRIDIPKEDVPSFKRRLEKYDYSFNPEGLDQTAIFEIVSEAWKK